MPGLGCWRCVRSILSILNDASWRLAYSPGLGRVRSILSILNHASWRLARSPGLERVRSILSILTNLDLHAVLRMDRIEYRRSFYSFYSKRMAGCWPAALAPWRWPFVLFFLF